MGVYFMNAESTLGVAYAVIMFLCIAAIAVPLPRAIQMWVFKNLSTVMYYFSLCALIPAWLTFNSMRELTSLINSDDSLYLTMGRDNASKMKIKGKNRHKAKVLKQERNLAIGVMGLAFFFIFLRFHKIFAEKFNLLANDDDQSGNRASSPKPILKTPKSEQDKKKD